MAAYDNLSHQLFFEGHRGVAAADMGEMNQKANVGTHWTAKKPIAESFAIDNTDREFRKPVIFHAEIPISSVETDTKQLGYHGVGGKFAGEQEIPVAEGAKVRITGRTTLRRDKKATPEEVAKAPYDFPKSRTRRYNPPREATA